MQTRKRRPKRKTRGGFAAGEMGAIAIVAGFLGLMTTSYILDQRDPEYQKELEERKNVAASNGANSLWVSLMR